MNCTKPGSQVPNKKSEVKQRILYRSQLSGS